MGPEVMIRTEAGAWERIGYAMGLSLPAGKTRDHLTKSGVQTLQVWSIWWTALVFHCAQVSEPRIRVHPRPLPHLGI